MEEGLYFVRADNLVELYQWKTQKDFCLSHPYLSLRRDVELDFLEAVLKRVFGLQIRQEYWDIASEVGLGWRESRGAYLETAGEGYARYNYILQDVNVPWKILAGMDQVIIIVAI